MTAIFDPHAITLVDAPALSPESRCVAELRDSTAAEYTVAGTPPVHVFDFECFEEAEAWAAEAPRICESYGLEGEVSLGRPNKEGGTLVMVALGRVDEDAR